MKLLNGLSPIKVQGYWFKIHTFNLFSEGFPPILGDSTMGFLAIALFSKPAFNISKNSFSQFCCKGTKNI